MAGALALGARLTEFDSPISDQILKGKVIPVALKDWELIYDSNLNKWKWQNTRLFKPPQLTREELGKNKNGFYPFEFNFLDFVKGDVIQCYLCGIFRKSRRMTRDHIYPKSLGGDKTAPACKPCNQTKLDMKPIEWGLHASKYGLDVAVIPQGYDPEVA